MAGRTDTSSPRGKTIGYLRVSTDEQDLEKNEASILKRVQYPFFLGPIMESFGEEQAKKCFTEFSGDWAYTP